MWSVGFAVAGADNRDIVERLIVMLVSFDTEWVKDLVITIESRIIY